MAIKWMVTSMLALVLGGCSGSTTGPVTLTAINITPSAATVSPGTSVNLRATGVYSDETMVDLTALVTWNSTDTSVATVSNAAGLHGVATAVGAGSSTISAVSGTVSGTATLTTAALQSIAVTPINQVFIVGTSQQFRAIGTLSTGATQDLTGQLFWSSSDPAVAVADSAGIVRATGTGIATVTASSGAVSGSSPLTVVTLVSMVLAPVNPVLDAGAAQQFTVVGTLSNGDSREVTSLVTLSSDDPAILTINPRGLATPLSPGSAVVSAAFPGIPTRSTGVTVVPPISLAVTPVNASVAVGSSQQFTATGSFADGSRRDLTTIAGWGSSSTGVATVGNAPGARGVVNALGNGVTLISATLGVTGSTSLTVRSLTSLAIAPAAPTLGKGSTLQLSATGTFSDGTTQNLTDAVSWTSMSPGTASVSDSAGSKGLLIADAPGRTTISVALGALTAAGTVTVTVGNEAFVTDFGSNLLSVIDTGSANLIDNISVGAGPLGLAVEPANSRIYVVNGNGGSVSVIDMAANTLLTTVPVGAAPWGAALNPASGRLYVSNGSSATVSVIDIGRNQVVATVPVGATPKGIAVDTIANRVYVANSGSNSLSVIDGAGNTVIGTVRVGLSPVGVALDMAAHRAYVTNGNSQTVTVVDTVAEVPLTTVVVGGGPWGVAVAPGSGRAYVANNLSGTLSVIDTAANVVVMTVPVGSAPRGVAVNPAATRVYVTNFGSNNVTVLDGTGALVTTIPGFIGPSDIVAIQ